MSNTRRSKRYKRGAGTIEEKRGKGKSEWIRGSVKHLKKSGALKKLPKPKTGSCYLTGKVRFTDEDSALRALVDAVTTRIASNAARTESRAYYCQYCDGWHLTSVRDTSTVNTAAVELAASHQDAFKAALSVMGDFGNDGRDIRKTIQHFMLAMDRESVPEEVWADQWLWAAVKDLQRAGAPASVLYRQFPHCLARACSLDDRWAKPERGWLSNYSRLTRGARIALMGQESTPLAVVAAFQTVKEELLSSGQEDGEGHVDAGGDE